MMQGLASTSENSSPAENQAKTIWRNPLFVKMFTAYSLSTFGDWFDMIAIQVLLAFVWNTEPMVIALLPLTYALPGILFGQLAGVLADQTKKRRLMIISDLLSAAITGLLVFAPNVAMMLVLLTMRSIAGTFYAPAQQALTRQVVAEEHLLKASTWNGMINQMAKIFGPMGGALVISLFSPEMCLLINAISFSLSALILLSIRHPETSGPINAGPTVKPRFLDSWREGWHVVLKSRVIFASLLFSMIGLLGTQLVDTQFSILLRDLLPNHHQVVGWIVSAVGLGSVLIIAYVNKQVRVIRSYGWLFGCAYVGIGLGFAWLGMLERGTSLLWTLLPGFVTGLGNGLFIVVLNYMLQKEPPAESVGRVSGIMNSMMSAAVIIAPLLGGVLVTAIGVSESFRLVGAVIGVLGVIGLLFQRLIWGQRN
jgi:MFS family permease